MKEYKNEKIIRILLTCFGFFSLIISMSILLSLILGALPFFNGYSIIEFITGKKWNPDGGIFGLLPLLVGTLKVVFYSMIIAIPLGLFSAIYLSEYANTKVRKILKPVLEILAGIPSIVYGFFAYNFINPIVSSEPYSTLGASIALGVMIVPMIASLSEDTLSSIPRNLREASLGVGATKSETIFKILLPAGLSGIISSIVLAISRAFGETMIVALAAGSVASMSLSPFTQSMTMTGAIVQTSGTDASVSSQEYTVLYAIGLSLFLITLILNITSKWLVKKYKVTYK